MSILSGLLLIDRTYSRLPICVEPVGRLTFCRSSASFTSFAVSPFACMRAGSRSIITRRGRPP